jgi:hypothetical protein
VSYLGRVAMRVSPSARSGLQPSRGSDSPLARIDQRLNLPGVAAIADALPFAHKVGAPDGLGSEPDAPLPPPAGRSIDRALPVSSPFGAPSDETGSRMLPRSSRPAGESPRKEARRDEPAQPRAEAPTATDPPTPRAKEKLEPTTPQLRRGAVETLAAASSAPASAPQRTSDAPASRPTPPAPPEIQNAFERLDRWLRAEPRSSQPTIATLAASGESSMVPRAPREGAHTPSARAPAAARTRAGDAPRLSIGRIEVVVVPPTPPATHVPAEPRTRGSRAARPTSSPSASLGHLTFGLRQR